MIDVAERERLELNMNEAFCEYIQAQVDLRIAKYKIAELALNNEPVTQKLREAKMDAERDMEYWTERLQEIKVEYIQLIREIKLPVIYGGERRC